MVEGNSTPATDFIHVMVRRVDKHDQDLQFKIRGHTRLQKLMSAYCDKFNVTLLQIRFVFKERQVRGTDTAQSLDVLDGDVIEVVPR